MGTLTVCNWQVMADPMSDGCWHFQTLIVMIALLQPLWTTCISNSFSLYCIPPPHLPKDCFPLITVLELSQQYMTFMIYELKQLQRLNGTQHIILASHLYRRLENPIPFCSSHWCMQAATPATLPSDTLTLLIIWQFTAKAGKSIQSFQKVWASTQDFGRARLFVTRTHLS